MSDTKKRSLSAFSILFIILFILWGLAFFLAGSDFAPIIPKGATEAVSSVMKPKLSTVIMSPFNGFVDALDIAVFILILGGFLNIVMKTGTLEAGVQALVKKLKGNDLILIPILMILFSIGGTVYGMSEETIAFYVLITATLVAAGFDTIVAVGVILLGSGSGVLGSTVNPFATGVAMDALNKVGGTSSPTTIIILGVLLWFTSTAFCIWYVMRYAKKVKAEKGSTILSLQEQQDMQEYFNKDNAKDLHFGSKEKLILNIFTFTFIVMIVSLIPWASFNITIFDGWTNVLTGNNFGDWYFGDLAMWFFIMSVVIGVVAKMRESEIVEHFIAGACDLLSVVLIIVVARAVSVLMKDTHLDLLILDRSQNLLTGLSPILFVTAAYLIYLGLSFLIPSTSGLATVSIPILGLLTAKLGMNANVMIMIFSASCGLVNLITPTSGVVMGGLQISKVNYSTWIKFMRMPIIVLAIMNIIILTSSMLIL